MRTFTRLTLLGAKIGALTQALALPANSLDQTLSVPWNTQFLSRFLSVIICSAAVVSVGYCEACSLRTAMHENTHALSFAPQCWR